MRRFGEGSAGPAHETSKAPAGLIRQIAGCAVRVITLGASALRSSAGRLAFTLNRHVAEWQRTLHDVSEDIKNITSTSEDEFLELGGKLQGYYTEAGRLSEMAATAAGQMSGEAVESAIREFQDISERISSQQGLSEKSIQELHDVLALIDDLQQPLDSFDQTVKTLNVLAVYTRIENAHLGSIETGFGTLADSIQTLATEIKNKSNEIARQTGQLIPMIRTTTEKIDGLKDIQHSRVNLILSNTNTNLEALTNKNRTSIETTQQMSQQYSAIYGNIGAIVTSMQFHDITRQKFEHIHEALDECSTRLCNGPVFYGFSAKNPAFQQIYKAAKITRLQSVQLTGALNDMTKAVGEMFSNLEAVRSRITGMCRDISEITGKSGSADNSFFADVNRDIASIKEALADYGSARCEVSSAMESVAVTVREVSRFIRDIQQIGIQIERIALNAQIRAAHIGHEGAALGELAEAIQGLSNTTNATTMNLSEKFNIIVRAAESMHAENAGQDSGEDSAAKMTDELGTMMGSIESLSTTIEEIVDRMTGEGRALADDIAATIRKFTVHERIASTVDQAGARLDGFVQAAENVIPAGFILNDSTAQDLRELEDRYTMQSERDIHQNTLDQPVESFDQVSDRDDERSGAAEKEEDDLGDNIELF